MSARTFFERLESREGAGLEGIDQSYRFVIEGEGEWLVVVRDGRACVTEGEAAAADATIRTTSEVFDRILSGQQNPATAYMSGKVKVDGDLGAVMKLQRLFP